MYPQSQYHPVSSLQRATPWTLSTLPVQPLTKYCVARAILRHSACLRHSGIYTGMSALRHLARLRHRRFMSEVGSSQKVLAAQKASAAIPGWKRHAWRAEHTLGFDLSGLPCTSRRNSITRSATWARLNVARIAEGGRSFRQTRLCSVHCSNGNHAGIRSEPSPRRSSSRHGSGFHIRSRDSSAG
jgi:hypothetical protein